MVAIDPSRVVRRCPLVERKAVARRAAALGRLLAPALCRPSRRGRRSVLDAVRNVGAESIVAKRRAGLYRSGPSRDWPLPSIHQLLDWNCNCLD
jgi:ATP-dependent DNA ligase